MRKTLLAHAILAPNAPYYLRLGSDGSGQNIPFLMGRDQTLTVKISKLGEVRVDLEQVDPPTREVLETALKSIANSSCCGCCQEAAKVAKSALGLQ